VVKVVYISESDGLVPLSRNWTIEKMCRAFKVPLYSLAWLLKGNSLTLTRRKPCFDMTNLTVYHWLNCWYFQYIYIYIYIYLRHIFNNK
jgi:hypothetical protein